MTADIKELQELIARERLAAEKVRKAREEAEEILRKAREKTESIVQAIESDPQWEKLKQAKNDEIVRKKAEMEENYKREVSALEKAAKENFEKAIERIIQEALRVQL